MNGGRVGLVLGAGGVVGQAYQAGVLAALEVDLGFDARRADVIVGSSAGSVTGALLRMGVPATDLARWSAGDAVSSGSQSLLAALDAVLCDLPPLSARALLGRWRPPDARVWRAVAARDVRPLAALSTMLPPGRVPLAQRAAASFAGYAPVEWPGDLWICATRRADGRRTVFSPSHRPAGFLDAIAASCAIPAFFEPVTVTGVEYVDGGLHSPTNAELLAERALDLVVVVSPMSMHADLRIAGAAAAISPLRWAAHRALAAEVRALRRQGAEVVCFEPGVGARRAMGLNPMATERTAGIVRAAFFEAGARAASPLVRQRLGAVAARARAA